MSGQPMPAVLDVDRVRARLNPPWTIRYVDETGSTNDDVRPLLDATGAGTVLVAEHQTAGRGRKGRAWIAPAGSALTFTFVLPRAVETDALWAVTFWSALVLDDAIATTTGLRTRLVWPNDVFLGGRKLAGILAVSRIAGDMAYAGVGIGLNVRRPADPALLATIEPSPQFLSDDAPEVAREDVLAAILHAASARLAQLDDPVAVARAWSARAQLAGTRYAWRRDDGRAGSGVAEHLGDGGRLVVRTTAGDVEELDLADVRVTGRD